MSAFFALVACTILFLGLLSYRLKGSLLSPFMLCTVIGYIAGPVLGFLPQDWRLEHEQTAFLLELTLILVLFSGANRLRVHFNTCQDFAVPLRLLSGGILLSVFFGSLLAALLFPEIGFWYGALLASILAATDATLAQSFIESSLIPSRWKQVLELEGGLNDGLVLPLVFFFKICASAWAGWQFFSYWSTFIALQIIGAALSGFVVGYVGAFILHLGTRAHSINHIFTQLSGLALAILAYALAESFGGNGFIAVFIAGLTLHYEEESYSSEFVEAQAELLSLIVFLIFGAFMLQPVFDQGNSATWLYALLTLTVVRIASVTLCTWGLGLKKDQILLLGCFGPRGIASLLFGLLVLDTVAVPNGDQIFLIVSTTVLLSTFLHGFSAVPLAKWYGARAFKRNEL